MQRFGSCTSLYFDYPLEQGLRQMFFGARYSTEYKYFDYPLEQGLRQNTFLSLLLFTAVF